MSLFWTLLVIILAFLGSFALFVRFRFAGAGGYGASAPAAPTARSPAAPAPSTPTPSAPAPSAATESPAAEPAATGPAAAPEAAVTPKAPIPITSGAAPALPPADGAPDDLKQISGVGPKLEQKLNGIGITQFQQIAAFTPAQVVWVDDQLSFKGRIERDDWIAQAKALAQGG